MVVSDDTLAEEVCHATTSISSRITTDWMGERGREREGERERERERERNEHALVKIYNISCTIVR